MYATRTQLVQLLGKISSGDSVVHATGAVEDSSLQGVITLRGKFNSISDLRSFVPLASVVYNTKKKLPSGRFYGINWSDVPHAGSTFLLVRNEKMWVVVVDLRAGSATYGQNFTCMLDANRNCAIYIPLGCAYGYMPMSSNVQISIGCTFIPSPTHEKSLYLYDQKLGIKLPQELRKYNFAVRKKTYLSIDDVTPVDSRVVHCQKNRLGEAIFKTINSPVPNDGRLLQSRAVDYVYDESCGCGVLHVRDYSMFIQALGKLKFLLHQEENAGLLVAFRGQSQGYSGHLKPSLFRGVASVADRRCREEMLEKKLVALKEYSKSLEGVHQKALEAVLQQYGVDTRWIDAVDNIWIALWFACHIARSSLQGHVIEYQRRDPEAEKPEKRYAYIYVLGYPDPVLYGAPPSTCPGLVSALGIDCLDLRISTPSNYVRPHAQHGLMLRVNGDDGVSDDFDSLVQAIVRIDLRNALDWLGKGDAVSVKGLFPSPIYDTGFQTLLCIQDRMMLEKPELYKGLAISETKDKNEKEYKSVYFQRVW